MQLLNISQEASTSTYYSIAQSLPTRLPFLSAVRYFSIYLLNISWYFCSIFLDIFVQYFSKSLSLYVHIIPSSSLLPFLSAVRYFLIYLFNISWYSCSIFFDKPLRTYYSIFQLFTLLICCQIFLKIIIQY